MNHSKILNGMPQGVKADRLIPWSAALQVVVPLIQINDPMRAVAIPLFEEWIKDRDQEISVTQTGWLWDNFFSHFSKEVGKRFTQWAHDPLSKELKNPAEVGYMQLRIWQQTKFTPWAKRLERTFWGRTALYTGTFVVAFPFVFVTVGLVTWALVQLQDPIRSMLGTR